MKYIIDRYDLVEFSESHNRLVLRLWLKTGDKMLVTCTVESEGVDFQVADGELSFSLEFDETEIDGDRDEILEHLYMPIAKIAMPYFKHIPKLAINILIKGMYEQCLDDCLATTIEILKTLLEEGDVGKFEDEDLKVEVTYA